VRRSTLCCKEIDHAARTHSFGGYGYGFGHGGVGVIGIILIIVVVLMLLGRV